MDYEGFAFVVGGEGLALPDRGRERDLEGFGPAPLEVERETRAGHERVKPSERVEVSLEVRVDGTAKRKTRADQNTLVYR